MFDVIIQLIVLLGIGSLLRVIQPGQISIDTVRTALSEIVFYLFLPALVLRVIWTAPLGADSIYISLVSAIGIFSCMAVSWLICRSCRHSQRVTGAVILAASFGNFTYLGLPVLVATLGSWAASVAIQYDLFASTPILFSVGFMLAAHFGEEKSRHHPLKQLFHLPPIWAVIFAVLLNVFAVPLPEIVDGLLALLSSAVIPLMLVAVGMSLQAKTLRMRNIQPVLVVVIIQLAFMPFIVWLVSGWLGLKEQLQLAVVLEAAMPSMVIGLVLCERYKLDTGVYATAVTVTTLLSLVTLPFWYYLLN